MKLDKTLMKQIIRESQEASLPQVLPRDIKLPKDPNKIIAVTGPRRSGKTYLLYGLIKELLATSISPERIVYLNLEDPRLWPFDTSGFEIFLEAYRELYPSSALDSSPESYLFLDEVQAGKNWESGVRRLYETRKFHIFITGSSSRLMSYDIATELRGRALTYELFPFSFAEFLKARGIILNEVSQYSAARFSLAHSLDEYLTYGGFPEVVLTDSDEQKFKIIKSYMETMFIRDLIERYEIRNPAVLRELVRQLATSIASQFSANAFYRWIKTTYPVTKRTVINYAKYLEDSRLFIMLARMSSSLKEQVQSPKKVYLVDVGLKEVFGFGQSRDTGRRLENTVVIELMRRKARNPRLDVFFWKDAGKREVDCIVTESGHPVDLIQVCANLSDIKVKEREFRALVTASNELKCSELKVVTMDEEGEETVEKKKIKIIPAWKWLIGLET